MILGIDPAFRHSGLCLYGQAEPRFKQFNTDTSMDFLSAATQLRAAAAPTLKKLKGKVRIVSMERQISVGASMSAMMFAAQLIWLEMLQEHLEPEVWIMPLVQQRRSYMKKLGVDLTNPTSEVRSFREQTGYKPRISIHCVHAYYLAKAGQDVLDGKWQYALPSKEIHLIPGAITNGTRPRSS